MSRGSGNSPSVIFPDTRKRKICLENHRKNEGNSFLKTETKMKENFHNSSG